MKQEQISSERKKRFYVKPTTTVYELKARSSLLAGSDPESVPLAPESESWPSDVPNPW